MENICVETPVATKKAISPAEAAAMITRREFVPNEVDQTSLHQAVAMVLSKAGRGLTPFTSTPEKVVKILDQVNHLLPRSVNLIESWLAIRALGQRPGSQIGVSASMQNDPIAMTLVMAAGLIPSADTSEIVRAQLGELEGRSASTVASNGRIVSITSYGGIQVDTAFGHVFSVDLLGGPLAALEEIDDRTVVNSTKANSILQYNTIANADLAEFSPSVFATYKVRRIDIPGAQEHPTPLVESSALASVLAPVPSYQPHLSSTLVMKGKLSDVQLETIIYAGEAHSKYLTSDPENPNGLAPRQGFLIGHGTGAGKGRCIAGTIMDNWNQGRRRHIWVSESAQLLSAARRDWEDLGGDPKDIIDIRDLPSKGNFPPRSGIIFLTYASLRQEGQTSTRIEQLVEWFGAMEDGVIAFDEAQNLRNSQKEKENSGAKNEVSRQGEAALRIQRQTPHSRVLYVSATSASDIASMGYAIRLGLWGSGTPFKTPQAFFKAMEDGGINALEMVARDLKAMGLYVATNLSYEGVAFERVEYRLTPEERAAHDELAELWATVGAGVGQALMSTGDRKSVV